MSWRKRDSLLPPADPSAKTLRHFLLLNIHTLHWPETMILSAPTLFLAAIVPVMCYYMLCYLFHIRPLPGIPVLPGAIPFFGHSYGMIQHVIRTQDLGGWFDQTVESGGAPRISQIMKTWREPE